MRKVDLAPYDIGVSGSPVIYNCREICKGVLFSQQLRLTGEALLKNYEVWKKVEAQSGDEVLLEEADYKALLGALNGVSGFGFGDIEFVERVRNAPEVPVKEDNG